MTATSVWFLGAVAIAGAGPAAFTFNFHVPAAFVRLFAMSRTAAKYGERVVGHRAALVDQVARRSRLFLAMAAAPAVRSAGWQLARQDRLNDYIEDVEDVDYARLRVGLPLDRAGNRTRLCWRLLTLATVPLALVPIAAARGRGMAGLSHASPRRSTMTGGPCGSCSAPPPTHSAGYCPRSCR